MRCIIHLQPFVTLNGRHTVNVDALYPPATMSVLVILGRKCTLAASRAVPWWATLRTRRAPY